MSIVPHYRTVQSLLQNRSFSIDEYQREYKWERANIEELISDLDLKFTQSYTRGDRPAAAINYEDYFLGSIIVTKRGTKSYLVDGQQRVTSLTLLLIYLYRVAKDRGLEVTSSLEPLIFSNVYGERKFNLDITERLPVIRALFEGEEYNADGKDESVQTIATRYSDIVDLDLSASLGDGLETFIYWLINNVGLIEIATETDNHAYAIFETMNDRGKPLSPVDMMKAFLLAEISDEAERSNANRVWRDTVLSLNSWAPDPNPERASLMLRAWLRSQYAHSIRERRSGAPDGDWDQIGTTFHRWLRDNKDRVNVGSDFGNRHFITTSFPFYARAYRTILDSTRSMTAGLEPVFYNAHNDFTWQPTVLLAPLVDTDDDETVRRKIAAVATYLDIWLMRRVTNYVRVGYSAVNYAMWLLCRDIRGLPLSTLIDTLQDKLAQDAQEISFEGSPSRGRNGVADLGLNQFSTRYIFHLLARLTAYTEERSGRASTFDTLVDRTSKNAYDIEHIWSNTYSRHTSEFATPEEFAAWRNNVAGLLLLPADVNRSLQDRPYEEKLAIYAQQNRYAASLADVAYQNAPQFREFTRSTGLPFRAYERYGKEQQLERRDLVLALINEVWSPSRLDAYRP